MGLVGLWKMSGYLIDGVIELDLGVSVNIS